MSLTAGTQLGPYEILGLIGAGGMGEVYKARDRQLSRDVAVKVLPDAFAADADRLARFEREARVLAALNHPHVAAIYGVEADHRTDSGQAVKAPVLELVEGPPRARGASSRSRPTEAWNRRGAWMARSSSFVPVRLAGAQAP